MLWEVISPPNQALLRVPRTQARSGPTPSWARKGEGRTASLRLVAGLQLPARAFLTLSAEWCCAPLSRVLGLNGFLCSCDKGNRVVTEGRKTKLCSVRGFIQGHSTGQIGFSVPRRGAGEEGRNPLPGACFPDHALMGLCPQHLAWTSLLLRTSCCFHPTSPECVYIDLPQFPYVLKSSNSGADPTELLERMK